MFCQNCGTETPAGGKFCPRCGASLVQTDVAAAEPAVAAAPGIPGFDRALYGGFWRRVAAYVIDTFILYACMFILWLVFAMALGIMAAGTAAAGRNTGSGFPVLAGMAAGSFFLLAGIVGVWLYYALFESSSLRATPGKRALDLMVATGSGARIGFGRATGRYFGKYISSMILCIGYIMVAFTARRQALHDLMADTVVVRNSLVGAGLQPITGDNVRNRGLGGAAIAAIALIGGFIPVMGILAAIAIPAFADYTIRAQVSEGLNIAGDYKVRVVEALGSGVDPNAIDNSAVDLPTTHATFKYVESIQVIKGAIVVTYGRQANASHLAGKSLTMMPGLTADRNVIWICGYAPPPSGVRPLHDDYSGYNTIAPKYLPSACRD